MSTILTKLSQEGEPSSLPNTDFRSNRYVAKSKTRHARKEKVHTLDVNSSSSTSLKRHSQQKEPPVCEFCGKKLDLSMIKRKENRKYCSEACRGRAGRGWRSTRLEMPSSKRYLARLKFTSPLYFD